MIENHKIYFSYLLRIWRDDENSPLRVQLENPHTGKRRGFPTLDEMLKHLQNEIHIDVQEAAQRDEQ